MTDLEKNYTEAEGNLLPSPGPDLSLKSIFIFSSDCPTCLEVLFLETLMVFWRSPRAACSLFSVSLLWQSMSS